MQHNPMQHNPMQHNPLQQQQQNENAFLEISLLMIKFCLFITVLAFWGWTCDYLIYGKDENFHNITAIEIMISGISIVLYYIIIGIFLFLAYVIAIEYPWSVNNYEGTQGQLIKKRICVVLSVIIMVSFSYPI